LDLNLRVILQQLEAEKSVDRETLLEAIRSAIESAARKSMNKSANVTVEMDPDNLQPRVFEIRTVKEVVEDPSLEISLEAARELNPAVEVGNRLKVPSEPKDFGRIAAQTAKQVMIQKLKDAERDLIFDEFKEREGELVTGSVKRVAHGKLIVAIGRAEAIIPYKEQSPRENFKPGDRIRALLVKVDKGPRGAEVILSRSAPELVRALFDLEVPEIYDGTVQIRAIAREAGSRTKVAVASTDMNVDAVGACVGMKGSRVRSVVEELSGEKIDIVRWSDDPMELCANALNPADILSMQLDEENGSIRVVVPQDQLSLAIGKRGQNARLASRLIGWSIDIVGEGEPEGGETISPESLGDAVSEEGFGQDPTVEVPTYASDAGDEPSDTSVSGEAGEEQV
jgi:N utilization substance protein A